MESITINWRLRKQRYQLVGQKCPICEIALFPCAQVCPNCGYKFNACLACGCQYNKKCEHIIGNYSNMEIGY